MPRLYLDAGNADIKWYTPDDTKWGYFRHALAPISERKWNEITKNDTTLPPQGYAKINDIACAFGDAARRYVIKERPKGAARYTPEYYGLILGYALSESLNRSSRAVGLYASHAPQDINYAQDIVDLSMGSWNVISQHGELSFMIKSVKTFDEPMGGFNHFILTNEGREKQDNPIRNKTCLLVDVGGFTVDVMAIDAGVSIDPSSLRSTRTGLINVMENFESDIRARYRKEFQMAHDLDVKKLEQALNTGLYSYGNTQLNCAHDAKENIRSLTNDILDIIFNYGGAANYDAILLTGGGAVVIHEQLRNDLPEIDVLLVERDAEKVRFANVIGGAKMFKMMEIFDHYEEEN